MQASVSSPDVRFMGDRFKVQELHADPVSAQVIKFGNVPIVDLEVKRVSKAVRDDALAAKLDVSVSTSAFSSRPDQARPDDKPTEPVCEDRRVGQLGSTV